ncbi:polyphenol oxidase family protein [Salidesulfovibrio onnuriiensis]|uniref:polyphenol oxidase family protein n=1 Tax=Salidesulfovibrio onnuriiensis TaxID=2583823 RepID=UPI0011C85B3D|nr:polyphenol oxidase family protein [Salidesulfovibrio onnuriiensis]
MSNIAVFPFAFEAVPGVKVVFTTRCGGVSTDHYESANLSYDVCDEDEHVYQNRVTLQKQLGFVHWNELKQVHGDDILFETALSGAGRKSLLEGDGLATTKPRTALMVKTADCQPIMLAHRSGNFVAGLHAGWRGNVAGFPTTGVQRFCLHYKLSPKDVFAVRGPSLGPLAAEFTNFEKEFPPEHRPFYNPETRTMDLWALTRVQLMAAGVPEENIFGFDLCTKTMSDTFFSYRASWFVPGNVSGRQAGFIWIDK